MSKNDAWLLDERFLHSQKLAAIGELAAGVAHEINNPLAVIRREVEFLQLTLRDREAVDAAGLREVLTSLHHILQQVERAGEITRCLLDFARPREPVMQGVAVNKLIEDMARLVEKEASLKDIEIIRDYDAHLPLIFSDGPQLRQVVLNLLTNAAFAIGNHGAITLRTRRAAGGAVAIEVSDTGGGVPAEHLTKIFDPFFTTKPPGQGTGLGLAICQGIVGRLGGRITVDSGPGRGATFTVILPEAREAQP